MTLPRNQILVGDVRERLAELPDGSVDCIITSPPYFQLRSYGVEKQIGLEPTIESWVSDLRLVMNGLARVLRPGGALWLNLGDTYSRRAGWGAPLKSLTLTPERLLLAAAADGWIVRNKVVWAKTNPMPHSVADRLSNSYDFVYFLTRRARGYFFDLDAIRLPHRSSMQARQSSGYPPAEATPWRQNGDGNRGLLRAHREGRVGHELGKNPGDVWPLPVAHFRGAHFATFPSRLVERPLLATCPERVCSGCGTPFRRDTTLRRKIVGPDRRPARADARVLRYERRYVAVRTVGELRRRCSCRAAARRGLVLDPFFGSGTVGTVAEQHDRDWLGVEINPAYARLAEQRIADERGRRSLMTRRPGGLETSSRLRRSAINKEEQQ